MRLHPAVTINNMTHTNSTGQDLALAICSAYKEAPDECELSWQVKGFMNQEEFEGLDTPRYSDKIYKESLNSHQKNEADEIFGSWHLYLIIFIILVLNVSVLLFVRHRMKT